MIGSLTEIKLGGGTLYCPSITVTHFHVTHISMETDTHSLKGLGVDAATKENQLPFYIHFFSKRHFIDQEMHLLILLMLISIELRPSVSQARGSGSSRSTFKIKKVKKEEGTRLQCLQCKSI